jgi:DNA-binding response OmpR family regulator
MSLIFVVCGSGDTSIIEAVSSRTEGHEVDYITNMDIAIARLGRKQYNLIIVSKAPGRTTSLDFLDTIRYTRSTKGAVIILVEHHPTEGARMAAALRGRSIFKFKANEMEEMKSLLERILH